MNNQPLVSFIIPFYNSGETIQEAVDSILNQSYNNYDIWIVNDGSTDKASLEKLNELEQLDKVTVLHQDNAGPSLARNKAIKLSKSKYIVPLDSDNTIINDAINYFVAIAEKSDRIDAVHGDIIYFGKKTGYYQRGEFEPVKAMIMSQIDTCALIKRSVFERGIWYDDFLSKPGLEDWEFWIHFHVKGLNSYYYNKPFFKMRIEYSSRTYEVANKNIDLIKDYISKKHNLWLLNQYNELYYQKKQLQETPDYRIGNVLLKPYRFLKRAFKKFKSKKVQRYS